MADVAGTHQGHSELCPYFGNGVDGVADLLPFSGDGVLAAEPGFEPGPKDPKSRVLPLHHSAMVPKAGFEPARELPPNSF
jgi:hypothetical protein